ncbi:GTPase ObgE [Mycoplasmopsis arginini]|uniref:GTPase Obg n=1 Tax=Mycoplasmopsis arginini TaxID=2094 RepID=A0ABZ2ALG9_MYCAR|nr:GTPase ObgE [Mycoplasmopsis arginini]ENY69231.1 GTP-binding protein Obg [Mycoplasmopsis arginini 7264]WVN21747.1 GTPase ObgE [Mycoplasmopsis arginini]VEU81761.1 GTPase obg [Mycoplasmopsis arginini]
MKFIDEVDILVIAGKGGDGIISFRREANVDKGGPDGGDGGNGGSVYFQGDPGQNTLLPFYYQNKIVAEPGENGKPKNAFGRGGEDLVVKVPLGTMVYKDGQLIADVISEEKYLIAKGGKGGKGNLRFKSSRNTAPRICENGTPGEKMDLHLTLKVLADVGFVGKPSAGKSTILSQISNAKPKIADYDFTTLVPQLGLVKYYENNFVVADLPGLIEKASEGRGLGIQFLKHIERCRVICHIIDFGDENKDPINDYEIINNELKSYNLKLEKLPQVIVANKSDLESYDIHVKEFKEKYPNLILIENSALVDSHIDEIKKVLWNTLQISKQNVIDELKESEEVVVITLDKKPIEIVKLSDDTYEIIGDDVYKVYDKIPVISLDNLWRFNAKLKSLGVFELIKNSKVKDGDTIKIRDYEFVWNSEDF